MVELTKETLLRYFPYRRQQGRMIENKSIYDALIQVEPLLWDAMNQDGELALKLFDYQADITQRKKDLEKMEPELSEKIKKKQEEFNEKRLELMKTHFDSKILQQYQGNVPFDKARNPVKAEQEFEDLKEEYKDVIDALEKQAEEFTEKMENLQKIQLKNTEAFTRDEIKKFNGKLVQAVRVTMDGVNGTSDEQPEPKKESKS